MSFTGLYAKPAGKVHSGVLDRTMKRERGMNKPLPWGRDKHLLFQEGMAKALQAVANEQKRRKYNEAKWKARVEVIGRKGST